VWLGSAGSGVSPARNRICGGFSRLRSDGTDNGVRHRACLGLPPQSGRFVGLWAGGRFKASELPGYIIAQVLGAIAGAGILWIIATGHAGFDLSAGFASNGYAEHSPGAYSLAACLACEFVMTFAFLFVIMGATHGNAPKGFAPIAIGLCLTLIHLISIPVTNTSVNPARSTGPALFVGGWALQQLWLFWLAPLLGGAAGGGLYRWLSHDNPLPVEVSGAPSP